MKASPREHLIKKDHHYKYNGRSIKEQACSQYVSLNEDPLHDQSLGGSILNSFFSYVFWGLNCLKIGVVVVFLIYSWVQTSQNRDEQFAIVHELSKYGYVNITYHHDKIVSQHSYEHGYDRENPTLYFTVTRPSQKEEDMLEDKAERADFFESLKFKPGKKPKDIFVQNDFELPASLDSIMPKVEVNLTKEEQREAGSSDLNKTDLEGIKNETVSNHMDDLVLSSDIYDVITEILAAELLDKTFCLIIIFTISWTSWRASESKKKTHFHPDGSVHVIEQDDYSINPIRIFLAATCGTCFMTVVNVWVVGDLYENLSKLMTSMLLVAMLIFYMYKLCHYQVLSITATEKLEKVIEADRKIAEDNDIQALLKKERYRIQKAEEEQRRFSSTFGFENIHQLQDANEVNFEKIAEATPEEPIDEEPSESADDAGDDKQDQQADPKEQKIEVPEISVSGVEEATKALEEIASKETEEAKQVPDSYSESDDDFQRIDQPSGCGNCCRLVKQVLIWFFMDIVFMAFISTQEFQDTSYLHSLTMRSRFTSFAILKGSVIAHVIMCLAAVLVSFLYSGFLLRKSEGHLIACVVIYFICSYELLTHVLRQFATYMDLQDVMDFESA